MKTEIKHKKQNSSLEEYVTFQQAQEKLSCSRGTLYNLIKSNEVSKYKIQAGSRLSARELQDYMERQKQKL